MPTMPRFEQSPPELVARFEAAAGRHPQAQRRKMFGYPALFVGGNLATSLYRDTWVVRLGPEDLVVLQALPGSRPFAPMPGRTMRGWATLPADVVADEALLDDWVARALAFAGSLPAKA
jgi:TfoX/Sxy family transcriptional regulator of competence genes